MLLVCAWSPCSRCSAGFSPAPAPFCSSYRWPALTPLQTNPILALPRSNPLAGCLACRCRRGRSPPSSSCPIQGGDGSLELIPATGWRLRVLVLLHRCHPPAAAAAQSVCVSATAAQLPLSCPAAPSAPLLAPKQEGGDGGGRDWRTNHGSRLLRPIW